jgi:hypothetical protein
MARFLDPTKTDTIGSVKLWTRPNTTNDLPPNWVIADGSTIIDPDSPFNGQAIPDLVDRFPQGAPGITNSSGLGSYESAATVIGGPAGHALNLNHSHSMQNHTHGMQNHTHGMQSHTHSMQNHTHGIDNDAHNHDSNNLANTGALASAAPGSAQLTDTHNHSHGGATLTPSVTNTGSPSTTDTAGPSTSSTGGPSSSNTNAQLSVSTDIRPRYTQMVYIVKIK